MKKEKGTRIAVAITLVSPGIAPTVIPTKTPTAIMARPCHVSAIAIPWSICSNIRVLN